MNQFPNVSVRCSAVVFRGPDVLLVRRDRDGGHDWVLPGGTPRPGESMAACARRETLEETGLAVESARIAFVLETRGPQPGPHTVDLVFLAVLSSPDAETRTAETGMTAAFVPLAMLGQLDLRPPIAGHLRGLHARRQSRTAAYLGNLWRPYRRDSQPPVLLEFAGEPAGREIS